MTDNTNADDSAINELREELKTLKAHNATLLNEKKKAKTEAEEAKAALDEATAEKQEAATTLEGLRAQLEAKHNKAIEKLTKERDEAVAGRNKLLIDNQISADLVANNVAKPFHTILTQALKAQAKVEGEAALIDGTPISEYISAFLGSDDGKHYVSAPANSGGGAVGATKPNGANSMPSDWNLTTYTQMKESDPAAATAYASKHGKDFS